jgi:hypothetical protein
MYSSEFWTAEKIALLGTDSDVVIAKQLGISHATVAAQRRKRDIETYARRRGYKWGQTELSLLGSYSDREIEQMTAVSGRDCHIETRSSKDCYVTKTDEPTQGQWNYLTGAIYQLKCPDCGYKFSLTVPRPT